MKTKHIILIMLILGIAFTSVSITNASKVKKKVQTEQKKEPVEKKKDVIETKTNLDPGFEPFWKEFQIGVAKNNKDNVAFMTHFPLKGDYAKGFPDASSIGVAICNESNFIKMGYDNIFQLWTKYIGKITNVESGKIENNTMYRFTSFPDLFKLGSLPDYLTNTPDGVQLEIYDTITPNSTFSACFYFAKDNGVYKLIATQYKE